MSKVFTLALVAKRERKRCGLGSGGRRLEAGAGGIKRRKWRRRGGAEGKMEGEKDNYRECYSTQEEAKVGDVPVVGVLGVEKGQQAMAETHLLPFLSSPQSS